MSTFAVDGLVSGLNTTEMIKQLMQIEAIPQSMLKSKSSEASKLISALQSLNTKVAALATSAGEAAKAQTWQLHTVTSSTASVTATAASGALPSSLQFQVKSLASAQVTTIDQATFAASVADKPTTIKSADTGETLVEGTFATLTDMAAAINGKADASISAVVITLSGGNQVLQLTGQTGSVSAFAVEAAGIGVGLKRADAGDAQIYLWGDEATGQLATSASNTFSNVLPGVEFVLGADTETATPIILTVAADAAGARTKAQEFVASLTGILDDIKAKTASTTTESAGRTVVTGGLFSGDSAIRFLADNIRAAVSGPVDGRSPSEVGLSIDKYGALSLDAEKFDKAMADDPVGTQAMLTAIAQRVAEVADTASDSIDGTLTLKVKTQEGLVSDLGRQIENWDRRLEVRRATLQRTYSSLEVMLGQLQSQQAWLAGQLGSLPQINSGK